MKTFKQSVEAFEKAAPWLGDADAPALVTLYMVAKQLDKGDLNPPLVSQFNLTYRDLRKRAPKSDAPADDLENALREAE